VSTKNAEKAYLARSRSAQWEAAKPFSYPRADTLAHSTDLLHDFAVAVAVLHPGPADLIVDLGAGGCWCSDLLARLNRHAVAVDISVDMLHAGASRQGIARIPAVAGDLEVLPFRSGSFHKAVCLNALHHVPDVAKAVREIARVLTDDGAVVFSEPGHGHATADVAVSAVRDYGVLEQEIPFGPLARHLRESGFQDVRLKALAYAVPAVELNPEQWEQWSRVASRRRPVRALTKMWRATLELFGLAKNGAMFDESFERLMLRTLFGAMRDHPVVVASKQPLRGDDVKDWLARLAVRDWPDRAPCGGPIRGPVPLQNVGRWSWRSSSRNEVGHVAIGIQLLDGERNVISRDFRRIPLPTDIYPGHSLELDVEFPAPLEAGRYHLKIDVVAEGLVWFDAIGSDASVHAITVT
jgi:SAM-dependent methyltransferase